MRVTPLSFIPVFIGFSHHPSEELPYVFLGCSCGDDCGNDYCRLKIASDQFLNHFCRAEIFSIISVFLNPNQPGFKKH
jgi:hypothetical protein